MALVKGSVTVSAGVPSPWSMTKETVSSVEPIAGRDTSCPACDVRTV